MEWTPLNIIKAIAIGIVFLIFASFIFSFVKHSFDTMPFGMTSDSVSFAPQMASYDGYAGKEAMDSYAFDGGYRAELSARNVAGSAIAPYPPNPSPYTSGNTAEEYEVTEYNVSYETQNKEATCASLAGLKSYSYVIFESANDHDRGCDYRFKVEHARVNEILGFLKGLGPKDLHENTYTIKNAIDDYTSETDVLENKRRAIDETLEEAIAAYDEITALATANQDAESLARIIDSKIQLIERLTQQKIEINTQLDRIARAKTEQLDRLVYTYFNVSAYENRYIDGENLADSWKNAVRATIDDANAALQAATLGLIAFIFIVGQWLIYGLVLLFIARFVLSWARRIWKGKPGSFPASRNGSRSRTKVGTEVDPR